jgi:ectoine hydroxylase-related dioxygenase (phytanoyl-CoA dioxygenase family)
MSSELAHLFARDGAVVIRGALDATLIDALRQGIDANLAAPSTNAKVASGPEDPGQFIEDFCCWQHNRHYRDVIWRSGLPALAAQLTRSTRVRLYHDHMLTKAAGTRQPTPWHQDQPYYNIDGGQTVSFWIPADPVPREASLEFVAGSHLGPWLMPRTFMDSQARWFPEGSLAELPDIDADPARYPVLGWALEPGDVVAFNMLSLHRAAGSHARRRVLSLRFLGDDVRHAPRGWTTSPDFPGLSASLPAGAEMDHPLFPLVWANGQLQEMPL